MRSNLILPQSLKHVLLFALAYLLWLVNCLVCIVAVIQLRATANVFWVALGGDQYTLGLVNQLSIFIGGFIAFIYVMALESGYRESVAPIATPKSFPHSFLSRLTDSRLGLVLRYFGKTTALPLGVYLACLIALEIALRIFPR